MQFLQKINRLRPHAIRASWAIAELAVSPLVFLALTPFLLRMLGVDQFGLWMLVMTVVGMGQLISLGAGAATIKYVSADLGAGKSVDAVATVRAAVAITLLGGGIVCLVAIVASPFIAQLFFSKMGASELVSKIFILGALLMVIQELDNVFSCALRGAQRFDLSAKVEFFTRLVWALAIGMIAWYFHSVVNLLLGALLLSLVKAYVKALQVNKLLSVGDCFKPSFERAYITRVTNFGKWQWVQGIGGALFGIADRLLIGALFGAADLARYSICMQLAQYVHGLPAAGMQVLFPYISSMQEALSVENRKKMMHRAMLLIAGPVLFIALPLIFFGQDILNVWMGEEFAATNYVLLRILAIGYLFLSINIVPYFVLLGIGRVSQSSKIVIIGGVSQILAALALAPFGLLAFATCRWVYALINLLLYRLARI